MKVKIESCRIENLRGFSDAQIEVRPFMALIGENNEGKSSLIKMLDFLLNAADDELLQGQRSLRPDEEALWLPANRENHRARRLTLKLKFAHASKVKKYCKPNESEILLRFSITRHDLRARLNYGKPSRNESFETKALDLLKEIRGTHELVVLSAVRDANSSKFGERIARRVQASIRPKLQHRKQAGAPQEYKRALEAIKKLQTIVGLHKQSLDIGKSLQVLAMMVRKSEIRLDVDMDLVEKWISENLKLAISTGDHDELLVDPDQVGNGLQSIIDIAMAVGSRESPDKSLFLVVEEPEAFLHPSAQRSLIVGLRQALDPMKDMLLITTHSPLVIDECKYPDAVLVRKRRFYCPHGLTDARRVSINSNLLSVPHAECFFSNLVLLVEGPGDRAFFNVLLHRLRKLQKGFPLSKVVAQDVGGKRSFAPWFNLFRSYGKEGDRPIDWVGILDADAAANDDGSRALLQAYRDSGVTIATQLETDLVRFGDLDYLDPVVRMGAVAPLNDQLLAHHTQLFSVDLEWAICGNPTPEAQAVIDEVFQEIGSSIRGNPVEQARHLGSKTSTGQAIVRPKKDPYIRAMLAERMPFASLPAEIKSVLETALGKVMSPAEVQGLLAEAATRNPSL